MKEFIGNFCDRVLSRWGEQPCAYVRESRPSPHKSDYDSYFSDPKGIVFLKESTFRSVARSVETYFGVITIVTAIWRVFDRFFPSMRFESFVGLLVLAGFWTLAAVLHVVQLSKARKRFRAMAAKSPNPTPEPPSPSQGGSA